MSILVFEAKGGPVSAAKHPGPLKRPNPKPKAKDL